MVAQRRGYRRLEGIDLAIAPLHGDLTAPRCQRLCGGSRCASAPRRSSSYAASAACDAGPPMPRGGLFAAAEETDLLARDVVAFFAEL
jgi:hypothetical protein